jgi:hypothetical protein
MTRSRADDTGPETEEQIRAGAVDEGLNQSEVCPLTMSGPVDGSTGRGLRVKQSPTEGEQNLSQDVVLPRKSVINSLQPRHIVVLPFRDGH